MTQTLHSQTKGHSSAVGHSPDAYLLPLSAQDSESLDRLVAAYLEIAHRRPALGELCAAAGGRPSHHRHRLAVVARDWDELSEQLAACLRGHTPPGAFRGSARSESGPRVAFVFPGQGGQWLGMGLELAEREAVFRQCLERCDAAIRENTDWSLLDELRASETSSRHDQCNVIQPVLWAIQVSLAALWRSWGVEPGAVVGQSLGEIAAAQVAGALSLEDAARVVCTQGLLLRRVRGRGAMAMVELSADDTRQALTGYEGRVFLTMPGDFCYSVVAGEPAAVTELLAALDSQGVFCRQIRVDIAGHCPQMDPVEDDLLAALEGIEPRDSDVSFYSTADGRVVPGSQLVPAYWFRSIRQPVLFPDALEGLTTDGFDTFVEISPHPLMVNAIEQGLDHFGCPGTALSSLRRDQSERSSLLASLGALYSLGQPVEWSRFGQGTEAGVESAPRHELEEVETLDMAEPIRTSRQVLDGIVPSFEERWPTLTAAAERRQLLSDFLIERVAGLLRVPASRIDSEKPLGVLGLDSLMALELRDRAVGLTGIELSAAEIWTYPTISALAERLTELAELSDVRPAGPTTAAAGPDPGLGFSAEDVDNILAELSGGLEEPVQGAFES